MDTRLVAFVFATSMLLASIHVTMGLAWLTAYGYGASRLGEAMRTGRIRRALEGASGVVLVAFGLRLAADRG